MGLTSLAYPGPAYPGPVYPGLAYPGLAYPGPAYPGLAYPGPAYPVIVFQTTNSSNDTTKIRCSQVTTSTISTVLYFLFPGGLRWERKTQMKILTNRYNITYAP
jgi:hypothetical protein